VNLTTKEYARQQGAVNKSIRCVLLGIYLIDIFHHANRSSSLNLPYLGLFFVSGGLRVPLHHLCMHTPDDKITPNWDRNKSNLHSFFWQNRQKDADPDIYSECISDYGRPCYVLQFTVLDC